MIRVIAASTLSVVGQRDCSRQTALASELTYNAQFDVRRRPARLRAQEALASELTDNVQFEIRRRPARLRAQKALASELTDNVREVQTGLLGVAVSYPA